MYTKTLGALDWLEGVLANKSQLGWWVVPTSTSPSWFKVLGIIWMIDQGSSWMKMMSKSVWVSRIVLTISKFFQTFWEKTFQWLQIIVEGYCSQLNRLIWTCFHGSQHISSGANLCCTYVSKRDMSLNQLDCYGTLWTLTFFFSFYLFFLILYFFSFEFFFLFLFSDDEEARDIAVTWHVTWCDIIGLEHSRRIWKMMSGHMYTTWWPWVRNEADMRM